MMRMYPVLVVAVLLSSLMCSLKCTSCVVMQSRLVVGADEEHRLSNSDAVEILLQQHSFLITKELFLKLYPNYNTSFYSYDAFVTAAKSFPGFTTQGSRTHRWREVAAFSAHVQQETAGLYYVNEIDQSGNYCDATDTQYPCAPGQTYFGRGPLQLSWNYNYGAASEAIGADILSKPYLLSQDPVLAFKSSLWFWMTPSGSIPSIHDVIIGKWKPSKADREAGRKPGFGLTIDIINGGLECGKVTPQAQNRVKYYKQFCKELRVSTGPNLSCASMQPWG